MNLVVVFDRSVCSGMLKHSWTWFKRDSHLRMWHQQTKNAWSLRFRWKSCTVQLPDQHRPAILFANTRICCILKKYGLVVNEPLDNHCFLLLMPVSRDHPASLVEAVCWWSVKKKLTNKNELLKGNEHTGIMHLEFCWFDKVWMFYPLVLECLENVMKSLGRTLQPVMRFQTVSYLDLRWLRRRWLWQCDVNIQFTIFFYTIAKKLILMDYLLLVICIYLGSLFASMKTRSEVNIIHYEMRFRDYLRLIKKRNQLGRFPKQGEGQDGATWRWYLVMM